MFRSLRQSLNIQKNVTGALIMREIITRYGRNNIGFLWLIVEPLLVTLFISAAWGMRGKSVSGINVYAFMLTGYPLMMMWRQAANRCIGAIGANQGLLYHRNIRVFDVYFSRVLLEVLGASMALIVLLIGFYVLGLIPAPAKLLYMSIAWLLMAWFGLGLGMTIGVLSHISEVFKRIWQAMSMVLMFASGAFYLVEALPKKAQEFALYIPMVHGSEMLRHGYFGDRIRTHEDVGFMIIVNVALMFVGLVLLQRFNNGVDSE